MKFNVREALARASAAVTYPVGRCYQWTRGLFGSPPVGDVDGDGDADAIDGWKAAKRRHPGDRNPPSGAPVFYSGGSKGYGHAAISKGKRQIRSTDAPSAGRVGTVDISWPERRWGMTYLGWTEDLGGVRIPGLAPKVKTKKIRASLAKWSTFVHLKASGFMDYRAAIAKAKRLVAKYLKRGKVVGVDLDVKVDKQGRLWVLHYGTVARNGLHDPLGRIAGSANIRDLTTVQVSRLRSKSGQRPLRLREAFKLCAEGGVRAELEPKTDVPLASLQTLIATKAGKTLVKRGHLQVKALASFPDAHKWLATGKAAGLPTILSFTGYKGKGRRLSKFIDVTDYVRGKARWI